MLEWRAEAESRSGEPKRRAEAESRSGEPKRRIKSAEPNFSLKTIWTGDNFAVMQGTSPTCVDVFPIPICLDPPFNSKRDYPVPIGPEVAGVEFKDTWTLNDTGEEGIDVSLTTKFVKERVRNQQCLFRDVVSLDENPQRTNFRKFPLPHSDFKERREHGGTEKEIEPIGDA